MIRSQIMQGEALKRRWLIIALVAVSAALALALFLLSTSWAISARATASKNQLAEENMALVRRTNELQRIVDARDAEHAEREREAAQSQELFKKLASSVGNPPVSPASGAKFAQAVYRLGGCLKTESRPSDKLFRNWMLNDGSTTEVYSVVGGFLDGKWLIYSNLVRRSEDHSPETKQAG